MCKMCLGQKEGKISWRQPAEHGGDFLTGRKHLIVSKHEPQTGCAAEAVKWKKKKNTLMPMKLAVCGVVAGYKTSGQFQPMCLQLPWGKGSLL